MNYERVLRRTHRCGFCGTKTTRSALKKAVIEGGYYRVKCLKCDSVIFTDKIRVKKRFAK